MQRKALFLSAAALIMGATVLRAQATNFAGSWTPIPDTTAAPAGGGRGGAGPMTIAQDATTLSISRMQGGNTVVSMYKLDGSPSKNTMTFGGNSIEATSTATWVGATLSIATTQDNGNGPSTTTAVYSLSGGNLMVATTRPSRNGGAATTRTVSYKKGM